MLMLGQATSWLLGVRGVLLVLRLVNVVTNLPSQGKQYTFTVTIVLLASMLVV
jgi:hypothetical protein